MPEESALNVSKEIVKELNTPADVDDSLRYVRQANVSMRLKEGWKIKGDKAGQLVLMQKPKKKK